MMESRLPAVFTRMGFGAFVGLLTGLAASAHAEPAKCQRAIIDGAATFVRIKAKALAQCEDAVIKGKLPRGTDCATVGAAKIAKGVATLDSTIARACGGKDKICGSGDVGEDSLGGIGWNIGICPNLTGGGCTTAINSCADITTCLQCIAERAVDGTIDQTYGALLASTPTDNKVLNKCQSAIGKAVTGFLAARSKALSMCWDAVSKGKATAPCPDGKTQAAIAEAEAKKRTTICKACGGSDKVCGGAADLDPLTMIGFTANCPDVTPPGGPPCAHAVTTLDDLVTCVDCVAEFNVDCADRAAVPQLAPYPDACEPGTPATPTIRPTPTLTATPTPTAVATASGCPPSANPCQRPTWEQGICGFEAVADFSVACSDADATTWGDTCYQGSCRGLFRAALWDPPSTTNITADLTLLRGVHCDRVLDSSAYAVGEFRSSAFSGSVSGSYGVVAKVDPATGAVGASFVGGRSTSLSQLQPLYGISGTGTPPPGVATGGYVAVGAGSTLTWFTNLATDQDSNFNFRSIGTDNNSTYTSVWGRHPSNAGEIYLGGTIDFVRSCPYPPTLNTCSVTIRNAGNRTARSLSGLPGGALPSIFMAAPTKDILYYPVVRENLNEFSTASPQGCDSSVAEFACNYTGEPQELFALSASLAYLAATGDHLLRYNGAGWARVTDLPATVTARRDFTAVWAGIGSAGATLVHVAAKTGTTLDYYLHDGTRWIGPINLATFTATNEPNFAVRDIGGCSGNSPILVGSANDAATNKRKGLILVPLVSPF